MISSPSIIATDSVPAVTRRMLPGQAEKLPADQRLGRHRPADRLAGPIRGLPPYRPDDTLRRYLTMPWRVFRAWGCRPVRRFSAPSIASRIGWCRRRRPACSANRRPRGLGPERIADGSADRLAQPRVVRHAIRLAQAQAAIAWQYMNSNVAAWPPRLPSGAWIRNRYSSPRRTSSR